MAATAGAIGPFALALLVPALQACANDGTGGKRVVLHTRLELASEDLASFDNALGWHVTLGRAFVATGTFAYFDGVPPLMVLRTAPPPGNVFTVSGWLGVGVARAHPGHYTAGNALGEMTQPFSVDLLDGTAMLADGDGVTGTYRSARFSFGSPPVGPFAKELDGHAVLVEGSAELDGAATRHFRAFADTEELAKIQPEGNIDGCQFDEVAIADDGTVTVHIDPSFWFYLVDFKELEPGSEHEPTELEPGSQPRLAFAQGLAQLAAYQFSYSK
ncbi:MAG TPA: hypothetical protein VFV94_02145 [Polyangiaceae bacterium]|nr:hypothetical protein [Polyangiaceae bacterium]